MYVRACVCSCVRALLLAYVHACVRAFVRACVRFFVRTHMRGCVRLFVLCVRAQSIFVCKRSFFTNTMVSQITINYLLI